MAKINLTCDRCGERVYRARIIPSTGKRIGYDCACARPEVVVEADNPFRNDGELRLQHIHSEDGKPLRVTSRRQLEEAQQRYHFNHIPSGMDRANWDMPKQQRVYNVGDRYRRKFSGV